MFLDKANFQENDDSLRENGRNDIVLWCENIIEIQEAVEEDIGSATKEVKGSQAIFVVIDKDNLFTKDQLDSLDDGTKGEDTSHNTRFEVFFKRIDNCRVVP